MDPVLGDVGVDLRVLDAMTLRARVALHNLANQDTPGFKRYEVQFEELLRRAEAAGTDARKVLPRVEQDLSGAPGQNNVDAMAELTLLMKARLAQDLFSRRIAGHYDRLRLAIGGQGG
ncbi:MAG: flagellar basal body rod protein FlgB [Planctomycetes bacterium]|nr:flagellar basal body rod protein FlgB [Planctomycetota bacterium]